MKRGLKLEKLIKHPKLFNAYPKFRDIYVIFVYHDGDEISYVETKGNRVEIKYNFYDEKNRLNRIRRSSRNRGDRSDNKEIIISNTIRLSESGRKADADKGGYGYGIDSIRKIVIAHELQHLVQIAEGMGGGSSNVSEFEDILRVRDIDEREIDSVQRDILVDESKKRNVNSSGEIEARDVANRLFLNDEERLKIPPLSSVEVDDKYFSVNLESPIFKDLKLSNSEKFQLSDQIKSAIDVVKNNNLEAFDDSEDELDTDQAFTIFMKEVFDEIRNLLPVDYDYYDVYSSISDYAHQ